MKRNSILLEKDKNSFVKKITQNDLSVRTSLKSSPGESMRRFLAGSYWE
jgi:hypothetical protein